MLMHKIRTALVVTGAVFAVYQGIDLQAQPVPNEQPKPVANVPLGPAQPQGSKATDDPRTTLPWLPWPSLGVSADGSRVVAPLSSQFNQVRIDLASGERKTLPESAIDPMFTPDGSLMLTTNGVLWDVKTWSKVRIFKAEEQRQVSCCCFSHDFKYIVTGSEDKTVRVWDARTGKELAKLVGHNDWVTAVAIDGRNKLVISGSKDRTARIWDWKSGEHLHSLPEEDILRVVAFGASGRRAVTLGWLSSARIWDTETGEQVALLKNTHGWKYAIIDPNGFRVVTYGHGYRREVARVWNIEDGRHLYSLEDPESVRFARFDHSGNRLVAGGEKTCVWDAKSGRRLVTLEDADGLRKACFSPDGTRVIGASPRSLGVWEAATGKPIITFQSTYRTINSLDVTPDGKTVISSGHTYPVAVWGLTTGEQELVLKGGHQAQVSAVAFSPDGSRIATASLDRRAKLWDAKTGDLIAILEGHTDAIEYLAYSPTGAYVLTGTGKQWHEKAGLVEALIWDAKTGKLITGLKGHTSHITGAKFSADESRVLTSSRDHTVRLWEVDSGKELRQFGHAGPVRTIDFGPDGEQIITFCGGQVMHWSTDTGKLLLVSRFSGERAKGVFSPDGRYLVVHEPGSPAELWNIRGRKKLRELNVVKPSRVAFAGDSRSFCTLKDGRLRSWVVEDR